MKYQKENLYPFETEAFPCKKYYWAIKCIFIRRIWTTWEILPDETICEEGHQIHGRPVGCGSVNKRICQPARQNEYHSRESEQQ